MKKIGIIVLLFTLSITVFSKKIVFSASEKMPYIGKEMHLNGYVGEVVTEAFKRQGYEVKIDFYPEARSLDLAKNGRVDGVLPISYSSSLTDVLGFSNPFSGNTIGIMKIKENKLKFANNYNLNPDKFLAEMKGKKIGVVRGRIYEKHFDKSNSFNRDFANTELLNLRKLSNGRVDLAMVDKYQAAYLIVTQEPQMIGKLEFIEEVAKQAFYVGFSKKRPDYYENIAEFNKGLEKIISDGTFNKILEKYGFENNLITKKAETKKKLKIGTVNNNEMLIMQKLSKEYEKQNPEVEIEWQVLDENTLRTRLLSSLAISDDNFDIMTIGAYETPIWAKNNWLLPINNLPAEYDVNDVLNSVREVLSYDKELFALPFYAESSMTYYRKDILAKAGLEMPKNPTYEDIKNIAEKINNPLNDFYGVLLRGKAGWGENMGIISTIINSYGGRWFSEEWQPLIDSDEWKEALNFYKELLINYGPKNFADNGFNECKNLMLEGKGGIWVDATVAAGMLFDPEQSKVADKIGFVAAPYGKEKEGANWLWVWSLAIPSSSKNSEEAMKFITWATSREYINLVGETIGWVSLPPGTRKSTYENEKYIEVAPFAKFVLETIENANPNLSKVPYRGIQYVGIPEFPAIGQRIGEDIVEFLSGDSTLDKMLKELQYKVTRQMEVSDYIN